MLTRQINWTQAWVLAAVVMMTAALLLLRPGSLPPAKLPLAPAIAIAAPAPATAIAVPTAPTPAPTATATPMATPIPAEWRLIGQFPEPIGELAASNDGEIRAFGLGGVWVSHDNGTTWILRPFTAEEDSWVSLFDGNPQIVKTWAGWPAVAAVVGQLPLANWEYRLSNDDTIVVIFCRFCGNGLSPICPFWRDGENWRALEGPLVKIVSVNAATTDGKNIYLANGLDLWQAKSPF